VTRLILIHIHVWDTTHSDTHSHVWHDSFQYTFTCVTRLTLTHIYRWDTTHSITHSYVWHDSFKYSYTCETRLILIYIHTCDTTHSNTHAHVWHDSFTYSFTCATRHILLRIHNCDITHSNTHSYVRHDLCVEQHESLKKVDQEQKAIIERLGNNEAWITRLVCRMRSAKTTHSMRRLVIGAVAQTPEGTYYSSSVLQVYFRKSACNHSACNYRSLYRALLRKETCEDYAFYAATSERRGSTDPWGHYESWPILQVSLSKSACDYRACNYMALLQKKTC